jgi:hypothetical protein
VEQRGLLATIAGVRADLEQRVAATAGIPREYLEHRGRYPERLPWLILVGKLLDEIDQAFDRWTTWAAAAVTEWPDHITQAEPNWDALEEIDRHARAPATQHGGLVPPNPTRSRRRPVRDRCVADADRALDHSRNCARAIGVQ